MHETIPVAEAGNVQLHCPVNGRYSFFNSPFPSHKLHTGVDIYPDATFGETAPSPVEGTVIMVRQVKAPKGRGFTASDHDTVMLIEPRDNPSVVVKLLHLDPVVDVGDRIRLGQTLGKLLRSGYYGWGTSAHIHAEIRKPDDAIRARGGYPIERVIKPLEAEPITEITGKVTWTQPEYTLLRLHSTGYGLTGEVNGSAGVLDGGIPYYGWMGIHLDKPRDGEVKLLGETIADIESIHPQSCIAKSRNYHFTIENQLLLGLSLVLTPKPGPIVKLWPRKIGALTLHMGQEVEVKLVA
ncbi:MAG: M23 family metallopeptidase [Candidatus Bathyarchaeota archaeon]|nr:M23 family metallopeptidase [Candidatus Bathyarchaeota archaeon]